MMTELLIGFTVPATLWLFKCSIDAGKEIAILQEKAAVSEKAHEEFKQVVKDNTDAIHQLTIAVEKMTK